MDNKDLIILVAGGSGLVGQNLTNKLYENGYRNVRVSIHKTIPKIMYKEFEYQFGDLSIFENCKEITSEIDVVFNCAAYSTNAVDTAHDPLLHVTKNVVINNYLIDAAYKNKVKKYIFISSSSVYPPKGDDPVVETDFLFDTPYPAYFAVGWMKRYAEIQCEMYAKHIPNPMTTIIIRPANLYGPYDKYDLNKCHVTPATIRKVCEGMNPIPVWGDGTELRDLLYIEDFVNALIIIMEEQDEFDIFNVGSDEVYSVNNVLDITKKLLNNDAPIEYIIGKPSMIPTRKIDSNKIKKKYNWKSSTTIEDGLRKTCDWVLENKEYLFKI